MHALAAPLLQHPIVPCQRRDDVHVSASLLLRNGALLENPGRGILVIHVRAWCRCKRYAHERILVGMHAHLAICVHHQHSV
eukprot:8314459-Pyramimonas_sp.AAC.1